MRDTSSVGSHVALPQWLEDLNEAVKIAQDKGDIHYSRMAALLLSWEDTDMLFALKEIERLQSVLEDGYGFEVEQWQIPRDDADLKTQDKVRAFLGEYGRPENLVVVYYAGHGRPGDDPSRLPVWYARASDDTNAEELNTITIQPLLTRAREDSPDVLFLHDCCHPLSAYPSNPKKTRAVVECIFAGGFESKVPAPGPDSFTHILTDELCVAESDGEAITAVELHRRLICRLLNWQPRPLFDENNQWKKDEDGKLVMTTKSRVTPCHLFLSRRHRPIRLVPISATPGKKPMRRTTQTDSWPKVLLAVRLEDDARNASELLAWLSSAPQDMIELISIHPSFSSLLLLAVSVSVWDNLPDSDAVSFVGFTRGPYEATVKTQSQNSTEDTMFERCDPESEEKRPPPPLKPANQDQKEAIDLLNLIDRQLPSAMRFWREVRHEAKVEPSRWLLDHIQTHIPSSELVSYEINEMILRQEKLLHRYLNARELLECENGLLDMNGRFRNSMGPIYHWLDFDQDDGQQVSTSSSTNEQSRFWSNNAQSSIAESAPSTEHEDAELLENSSMLRSSYLVEAIPIEEDHSMRMQHTSKFKPGMVIKAFWSEPRGLRSRKAEFLPPPLTPLPELVFTNFRIFLIIATGSGHSMCLPFLTYGNMGCAKHGVRAHSHGIVYSEGSNPQPAVNEPPLGFAPVAIKMCNPGEVLNAYFRVNYTKMFTIEHNIPVQFIGRVKDSTNWGTVRQAVDICWEEMQQLSMKKISRRRK